MSTATPTNPAKRSLLGLHVLVPLIILLYFMADLGLRFVPAKYVAFRCWEEVMLSPTAEGPYTPNDTCSMGMASGDLSSLGNLPSLRQFRPEVFTTDGWGYRNPANSANLPISVLLVGDSFGGGCGVTDSDTLSAQLERLGKVGVYNAAGAPTSGHGVEQLIQRLKLENGLVIWEQSARFDPPTNLHDESTEENGEIRIIRRYLPESSPALRRLQEIDRIVRARYAYSPLKIWLRRGFNRVRDRLGLANLLAVNVVELQLKNGQPMLFLPSDVNGEAHRTSADFFVQLNSLVQSSGDKLLVLLVPDKYEVYYPLLKNPPRILEDDNASMGVLARNLRNAGVPVLDLTAPLREQAVTAFANGGYNYLLDDTHWNALGIQKAAQEIFTLEESNANLHGGQGLSVGAAPQP
jgi:hypothetical protein